MNGKEALYEKLREMGATKQQCESKIVEMMLAIFAENNGFDALRILQEKQLETDILNRELNTTIFNRLSIAKELERKAKTDKEIAEKARDDLREYVEQIKAMETPIMRDRLRMARLYRDMAYTDNAYAKTEYTKNLGLIMAGEKEILT